MGAVTVANQNQNYLAAGPAIAERIRQACPAFTRVLEVQEAEDAKGVIGAVALVVFAGESLSNADGRQMRRGADCVAVQRWLVQVVVDNKNKQKALGEAGFLLGDVIRALQGWKPENAVSSLYRVSPPNPFYGDGFASYPLLFELAVLAESAN